MKRVWREGAFNFTPPLLVLAKVATVDIELLVKCNQPKTRPNHPKPNPEHRYKSYFNKLQNFTASYQATALRAVNNGFLNPFFVHMQNSVFRVKGWRLLLLGWV